jgi:hypothetical protein
MLLLTRALDKWGQRIGYRTGRPRFVSQQEQVIVVFSTASRPCLEPTPPPVNGYRGLLPGWGGGLRLTITSSSACRHTATPPYVITTLKSYHRLLLLKETQCFGSYLCFRHQVTIWNLLCWVHCMEIICTYRLGTDITSVYCTQQNIFYTITC